MVRELATRVRGELLLACCLAVLLLLYVPVRIVAADTATESPDRVELTRLSTSQLNPTDPDAGVRIDIQVDYHLSSIQNGFIVLALFEDEAKSPGAQSSPIPIDAGSGRVNLDVEYSTNSTTQELQLLIAMYSPDKKLIGWLATAPLPLSALSSRLAFQNAMTARQGGDSAQAIDGLTRAISLSPDTGGIYYWRADTLLRQGRYDDAIEDYTIALRLMPQNIPSMVGRGVARVWMEQWDEGINDLTTAIEESADEGPLAACAHRARGVAYAALSMRAEAIADYEAYLSMVPDAADRAQVERWIDDLR